MSELWGVSSGQRQSVLDQAQVDQVSAMSNLHTANAQHLQAQDAQAALMMKMLQEPEAAPVPTGPVQVGEAGGYPAVSPGDQMAAAGHPDGLDETLKKLASDSRRLAKAGFLTQAEGAAKTVEGIQLKRLQERSAASQAAFRDSEVKHERMSAVNALTAGITDEKSFNAAKMIYMSDPRFEGVPIPPVFQHWNPEKTPALIEAVRRGTKEGIERLNSEMRDRELNDKEGLRSAREDHLKWVEENNKVVTAKNAEIARLKAKAGKDIGAPTKAEIDMAIRMIADEYKDAKLPASELARAADDVASRAKIIRSGTKISAAEATSQAFLEFKPNFDTTVKAWYEFGSSGTKYKRPGAAASTPKPLPVDESGNPDRKQYQLNHVYKLKDGSFGRWTGNGFLKEGAP